MDESFINDFITSYKLQDIWIESDKVIKILQYGEEKDKKGHANERLKENLNQFEIEVDYKINSPVDRGIKKGPKKQQYLISIDCFKQLCMMRKNDIGKKIRQYFITVEKLAFQFIEYQTESKLKKQNKLIIQQNKIIKKQKLLCSENESKNLYKIGITNEKIKKRISSLNTSISIESEKIYEKYSIKLNKNTYKDFEKLFHKFMKQYNSNGEWYFIEYN